MAEQGICTDDGPICFEHYVQVELSCNACVDGYKMKDVRCVSDSLQVGVIVGGILGSLLAIALLAVLIHFCVKGQRRTADEVEPLIK